MKVKSAGMLVVAAGYVWSRQTAAATGKGWRRLCSRGVRSRVVGRCSVGLVSRESGTSDDAVVGVRGSDKLGSSAVVGRRLISPALLSVLDSFARLGLVR